MSCAGESDQNECTKRDEKRTTIDLGTNKKRKRKRTIKIIKQTNILVESVEQDKNKFLFNGEKSNPCTGPTWASYEKVIGF